MQIGFSESGFRATAGNAVELISATQAASTGHLVSNIRSLGNRLHADMDGIQSAIQSQTQSLGLELGNGFGDLKILSGASLAIDAVGFATVAYQLSKVGKGIQGLEAEFRKQGELMLAVQNGIAGHLSALSEYAARSLNVQEQILSTLVNSRIIEAQQLARQGLLHLRYGQYPDAENRFQKALEFDSTFFLAHAELGSINETVRNLEKAEFHYSRALLFHESLQQDYVTRVRRRYARFLDETSKKVQSVEQWKLVVQELNEPLDRIALGEVLAEIGNREEALAELRVAVTQSPPSILAIMSSIRLGCLGKELSHLLIEVDAASRKSLLDQLALVADFAESFTNLAELARTSTPNAAQDLSSDLNSISSAINAQCKELLRRSLIEPYSIRNTLIDDVKAASTQIERLLDECCNRILVAESGNLRQIQDRLSAYKNEIQKMRDPDDLTDADKTKWIVARAGVAGMIALINPVAGIASFFVTKKQQAKDLESKREEAENLRVSIQQQIADAEVQLQIERLSLLDRLNCWSATLKGERINPFSRAVASLSLLKTSSG